MRVMVATNSSQVTRQMAKSNPDRIGWLIGPSFWKNPINGIAYALDNDAFTAWRDKTEWDELAWLEMLDKAAKQSKPPLWCLVPDVVADRERTIEKWHVHSPKVKQLGFPTAFAVQDGMSLQDVPEDADVVFIGGTTSWKWRTLEMWTSLFSRVHVGRVRQKMLMECYRLGAESCDGTGWFREGMTGKPARFLRAYVEGYMNPHPELCL